MTTNETCTLNEARELLGVSEKTIRNYCKSNKIPFFKERNIRGVLEYRFRREDLLFFLQQHSTGKHSGKYNELFPVNIVDDNIVLPLNKPSLPGKTQKNETEISRKKLEKSSDEHTGNFNDCFLDKDLHAALLSQLKQENAFLKELLLEKEKQLATKDTQLERCMDKISALSETLALITRESLTKEFP